MVRNPDQLRFAALQRLPYEPTSSQHEVLEALCRFVCQHEPREVFVLNGYAGTGKTSLVGALIGAMASCGMRTVVLAPTGRAAKVAEKYSARRASTVHRHIYRRTNREGELPSFALGKNSARDTLYIIDEASMVTDGTHHSMLSDLTQFIYSAPGCAMVLVGDVAQLPPVGQDDSPAMNTTRLTMLGLTPVLGVLTEPVRQASESGILANATTVRRMLAKGDLSLPRLDLTGYHDISEVSMYDFADRLSTSWSEVGQEDTIIITRSNRRSNDINHAVRTQIMYADEPLCRGERLVVAKNNYYWAREVKGLNFLANGETVVVNWIGRMHKAYGLNFVDTELTIPGREDIVISAKIMLRSLRAEGPSLPQSEINELYRRIFQTKEGSYTERALAAMEDEYYNALQVKYGYCVTCHKAQGGQWRHVYIDTSGLMLDQCGESFHRWLYTALTRATDKVFLIQPPPQLTGCD